MSSDEPVLFVGVDGGGSRCRVRVRDARGVVVASGEGGAANVYLDFDAAIRTIRGSVQSALAQIEDRHSKTVHLGAGLAGVSSAKVADQVAHALEDLGRVTVCHDGEIACMGAHDGRDGGLVIAGTGSAGVMRVNGRMTAVGGRGFILGDDGSGARLGLEAWRRALRAYDGFEPQTPLTRALLATHDGDVVAVIRWGRAARSTDFAETVPLVLSHAADGDPLACELAATSGRSLAELGATLVRLGAPRLCLTGGLAGPIRPYLPEAFRDALHEPIRDALDGALLLAGCPLRPPAEKPTPSLVCR